MLLELRVKNFAIINEASVSFEEGFNVLTGETGAGKSLLVDALLLFFSRGGGDYIKSGEDKAFVEACFEMDEDIKKDFHELAGEEFIVLRKVLQRDGKTRSYINGGYVSQGTLTNLFHRLLHIYGQSEERELYDAGYHQELFDLYARASSKKKELAELVRKGKEIKKELKDLLDQEKSREKEMDYLKYQIEEIESAELDDEDEEERLKQKREILQSREKMITNLSLVYESIYGGEGSCYDRLARAEKLVIELPLQGTEISDLADRLSSQKEEIKNFSIDIQSFIDKLSEEELNINEVEERLNTINKLKKKYGFSIREIKGTLADLKKRWENLQRIEVYKDDVEKGLNLIRSDIKKIMQELSQIRAKSKKGFESDIIRELKDLGMEKADFEVRIEKLNYESPEDMPEDGDEKIEFYFSAHKSEEKKPLSRIASGGELSRIMLAIKNIIPMEKKKTFIFDEVDSGVGGITAEMIGRKLNEISKRHQVLCITHLPQVAVFANNHIVVQKREINGKINVSIKKITGEERVDEITRMLGGERESKGRDYAIEMIKKGERVDQESKGCRW